jgi:hydroxyacylglutathione hydrolase
MFFRQMLHEQRACISYMIGCPSKGVMAVVDPQGNPEIYQKTAEHHGMRITHVIETHIHADHLSGAKEMQALTGAPIYHGPGSTVYYGVIPLAEGQILMVGNRHLRVIHTPGHTPEHISLLGDDWYLLTGDTLFVGDVGRVDLASETLSTEALRDRAGQLYQSLQRLLQLPDWVEIYPGHYAGSVCGRGIDGKTISTIGRERRENPALRRTKEDFMQFQLENLPPLPVDFHTIKNANLGHQV